MTEKLKKSHWYLKVKKIIEEKQYKKINGQTVDLYTASMMDEVIKKMRAKDRDELLSWHFNKAHFFTMNAYRTIQK